MSEVEAARAVVPGFIDDWDVTRRGVCTVSSWNVKWKGGGIAEERARLLARTRPHVVLLQEVQRHEVAELMGVEIDGKPVFKQSFLSLDVEPAVSGRRVGEAVLLTTDWAVRDVRRLEPDECFSGDLIHGLPFKVVMVDVDVPLDGTTSRTVTFVSAHARPASGEHGLGALKASFVTALARRVEANPYPVVLGIDANAPDVDHPDEDKIKLGWDSRDTAWERHELDPGAADPTSPLAWGQDRLLGPTAWHLLRDVYRDVHDRQGRQPVGPDGPLFISHPKLGKRYDHLLASPGIHPVDCDYWLDGSLQAGSDHALVTATLKIPDE